MEKWRWNGVNGATRSPVLRACKSIAMASNFIIVEMFQFTNYGDVVTSNKHLFPFRTTTELISMKHPWKMWQRPPNLLQYIFLIDYLCSPSVFATWPKTKCVLAIVTRKIMCLFWITYNIISSISLPISISNGILRWIFARHIAIRPLTVFSRQFDMLTVIHL